MNKRDFEIARQLKKKVQGIVDVVDFKVFGSRARGDSEQYSDLDVFIEVAYLNKTIKDRILEVVWEVSYYNNLVIAPLIYTKEEIENSPLRSSPIVKNIAKEGITV